MENRDNLYDVIIVGAGPAGLSSAIYMARAKYRVLVLEKEKIGGQITITSEIVNYPGVERTSGKELTGNMKKQAESFGAEFAIGEVIDMELEQDVKLLRTTGGDYRALGVVLAVGANPRKLGFKGEKEFQGRGVAYCATCDGEFFSGMEVFVIGGGFAAVEEGIFLTKYAKKVTMIVREDDFTCARTVSDQVRDHDKITVKFHTEIREVNGEGMVSFARFADNQTGEEWTHEAGKDGAFGVFVFAGYVPNTAWITQAVKRNEQGYLITDEHRKTNLDGVYAAGDVCVKELRQVVTAVSDGAAAATSLEKYVSELHTRLNLPEFEVKRAVTAGKSRTQPAKEQTGNGFISAEIKEQLEGIFAKFQSRVIVKAWLDDSSVSGEISGFLGELEDMTDKVSWVREQNQEQTDRLLPSMELCREDGTSSGIEFHGVPGGHEFNSFIIALYNVAGPGQDADPEAVERLKKLNRDIGVKVMVSLSCTMCPEAVMAAQKAAALSEHVRAEMIDLQHYPKLKEKYRIMSVPCIVINDRDVYFGKKNFGEMAELLTQTELEEAET